MRRKIGSWLRVIATIGFSVFLAACLWSLTVQGFFETASRNVPHYASGAGDYFLIFRLFLALAITLMIFLLVVMEKGFRQKLLALLAVPLPIAILYFSVLSLTRWSDGFSEGKFLTLQKRFEGGSILQTSMVLRELGDPLIIDDIDGKQCWSYSYMPSGGFGWPKRTICFSESGIVSLVYSLDEP
jgi:hypothetical protein